MRLTFLGTGTSHGVPMIGCQCGTCMSQDHRDKRYRSSIHISSSDDTQIVIDCPPEFRLQALRANLPRIDAVLLTHSHADHLFGMDDLRRYNQLQKDSIPILASSETLADVGRVFNYAFVPTQWGGGKPQLSLISLEPMESHFIGGLVVTPLTIGHGELSIYGYRIDEMSGEGNIIASIAYLTDCSHIPSATYGGLIGLDILVLGALRHKPHPTHFTLGQALDAAKRINSHITYFTHLAHDIKHSEEENMLPEGVRLAYDGLVVDTDGSQGRICE